MVYWQYRYILTGQPPKAGIEYTHNTVSSCLVQSTFDLPYINYITALTYA